MRSYLAHCNAALLPPVESLFHSKFLERTIIWCHVCIQIHQIKTSSLAGKLALCTPASTFLTFKVQYSNFIRPFGEKQNGKKLWLLSLFSFQVYCCINTSMCNVGILSLQQLLHRTFLIWAKCKQSGKMILSLNGLTMKNLCNILPCFYSNKEICESNLNTIYMNTTQWTVLPQMSVSCIYGPTFLKWKMHYYDQHFK